MLDVDTLSAELERLYDLAELEEIGKSLLGLEPGALGGAAKAPVARGLAERCVEKDAVEALLDAMQSSRRDAARRCARKTERTAASRSKTSLARATRWSATSDRPERHGAPRVFRWRSRPAEDRARSTAERRAALPRRDAARGRRDAPRAARGRRREGARGTLRRRPSVRGRRDAARLAEAHRTPSRERALALFYAIAEALAALHERRIVHGALHLGNVLVVDPSASSPRVLLLDAGAHLLRPTIPQRAGDLRRAGFPGARPRPCAAKASSRRATCTRSACSSTRCSRATIRSTAERRRHRGRASDRDARAALLRGPRGVGPDIDALVISLLEREPESRPRDGTELVEASGAFGARPRGRRAG